MHPQGHQILCLGFGFELEVVVIGHWTIVAA